MKSKEFIIAKLKELAETFLSIRIRYKNDTITNTHLIEICPEILFKENEDYFDQEEKIEKEFYDSFSEEEILFISENSLTQIIDSDFEIDGSLVYSELLDVNCYEFIDTSNGSLEMSITSLFTDHSQTENSVFSDLYINQDIDIDSTYNGGFAAAA